MAAGEPRGEPLYTAVTALLTISDCCPDVVNSLGNSRFGAVFSVVV